MLPWATAAICFKSRDFSLSDRPAKLYNLYCLQCTPGFIFLEPMLLEPGLGILPGQRDHLALDEPKASAALAHLNPGSG